MLSLAILLLAPSAASARKHRAGGAKHGHAAKLKHTKHARLPSRSRAETLSPSAGVLASRESSAPIAAAPSKSEPTPRADPPPRVEAAPTANAPALPGTQASDDEVPGQRQKR